MGRFLNGDSYASTGQGIIGCNMFTYCGNSVVSSRDATGSRYVCFEDFGGQIYDQIIYYLHPESQENLEDVARTNHSDKGTKFIGVSSFDELTDALNATSSSVNNVYLYLHGGEDYLSFYYAKYYYADNIEESFKKIKIFGEIYLFSCEGGRGELASTMASATNCTVIASEYKVSFGDGYARCGWLRYYIERWGNGATSWYSFSPDGGKNPYSQYYVLTK